MSAALPVLIAARNEASFIGETLASLDRTTVEPFVIVNDSNDGTAAVAKRSGAQVFEREEPGKIAAIQFGLGVLGKRALGPVLYLDADSHPVFPRRWAGAMVSGLGPDAGAGGGLFIAGDGQPGERLLMSALRVANILEKRLHGKIHVGGMNMITKLNEETLAETLALDNVWHKEDKLRALAASGDRLPRLILRPTAAVKTSSRFLGSPMDLIRAGKAGARQRAENQRIARTAPGVN